MYSFSPQFALLIDEVGDSAHTYSFQVDNEHKLVRYQISHLLQILDEHKCSRPGKFYYQFKNHGSTSDNSHISRMKFLHILNLITGISSPWNWFSK